MTDKICFYSRSKSAKLFAGKGEEKNSTEDYTGLEGDFRRILSNFHVFPFEYEGKRYNTIEHAFQAKKIALADPVVAERFTLDSGDDIGKGDGYVAQRNRKAVKLNKEQLEEWEKIKGDVLKLITEAKYDQCTEAREILKNTRQAELWHIQSRKRPDRFVHLEEIRTKYLKTE